MEQNGCTTVSGFVEGGTVSRRQMTRRQVRRAVLWRVFYGTQDLAAEGSLLDMHETGCRIAGCMPVEPCWQLRLCIWPSDDPKDIVVCQGTVKWAKGLEFGLALDASTSNGDEQNTESSHPTA